jgi:hypothetical protein
MGISGSICERNLRPHEGIVAGIFEGGGDGDGDGDGNGLISFCPICRCCSLDLDVFIVSGRGATGIVIGTAETRLAMMMVRGGKFSGARRGRKQKISFFLFFFPCRALPLSGNKKFDMVEWVRGFGLACMLVSQLFFLARKEREIP